MGAAPVTPTSFRGFGKREAGRAALGDEMPCGFEQRFPEAAVMIAAARNEERRRLAHATV